MYLARAVLDRQAPAQSDQSAGSCRGLDLVASCSQFYMKATSAASLIVDDHHERSAFVNAYPAAGAVPVTGCRSAYGMVDGRLHLEHGTGSCPELTIGSAQRPGCDESAVAVSGSRRPTQPRAQKVSE